MPADFSYCSLNWVRVFENHDCFSGDSLRKVLWLLTAEILLEQIDLIVLSNAFLSARDEVLRGLGKAIGWVSVQLFQILLDISSLSVVVFLRPT